MTSESQENLKTLKFSLNLDKSDLTSFCLNLFVGMLDPFCDSSVCVSGYVCVCVCGCVFIEVSSHRECQPFPF